MLGIAALTPTYQCVDVTRAPSAHPNSLACEQGSKNANLAEIQRQSGGQITDLNRITKHGIPADEAHPWP